MTLSAQALITVAEYAQYTGANVPSGTRVSQWEESIEVASSLVEQICGRQFHAATSSPRYYDPVGDVVWIDDAQSVSAVAVDVSDDGTWSETVTDYQLLPLGGWDRIIGSGPYTSLRSTYVGVWPCGNVRTGSVKVTAVWGWATVPANVKRATAVLVQDLLRDPESNFGGLTVAQDGIVLGSRIPARVSTLLDRYIRVEFTVGIG